ncbi:PAS domain-containing protein [Escherichia coli]|uniref:PAS domain-containing protein n=1 Tax=Shigella flexneri TaxID=623 RepID=UPI000DA4EC09|nr:PAS domain-containing protein [Shigella flexneri]SRJ31512.1 aerotaxis receptor [Shigella flexneri]
MRQNLPVTGRNLELPKDANILSTTSPQSHITYVNPDFIKISGFTEEELLGQPHNIVRHPDMPPAAFEHMWSTLKSGRSWMGLVKNRCKNGDHYWVSAYVTPIAKNGSIVEYQSVRTKPEPEQVLAAEKLYAQLRSGKAARPKLAASFSVKILLLIWGSIISSRQPDGCGLSWSAITVIKTGNVIVFQVVIWPVQLNPVNVNPPLKEANFPAMS